MWIEYETEFGKQYVNSETQENIQAYGNDKRYPAFKASLDSGEITVTPFKAPDNKKAERILSIKNEIEAIEKATLRNVIALAKQEDANERQFLNNRIQAIEALRQELRSLE